MLELLESKALDQITIPEIASSAGIGRTTFFRHYPSKEALLDEVAAEELRQLVYLTMSAAEVDDTYQSSLTLCSYVSKHRKLWKTLLTGGAASALREEFIRISKEVTSKTKRKSTWLPADAGIILVVSGTIELFAWWLEQKRPLSVKKVARIYERAILAPIYQPE